MKKIILLATALMMAGCNDYDPNHNIDTKTEGSLYETIIIDSCEYVKGFYRLSHKGKCRFCEERDSIKWEKRKKELKELVERLKKK